MNTREARVYMKSVLVAPETMPSGRPRARCRRCRSFLWDGDCYLGQFCTPDCAGIRAEFDQAWALIQHAERNYCSKCGGHHGRAKKIYHDPDQAAADAAQMAEDTGKVFETYRCRLGHLHVGSPKARFLNSVSS